jgi:hypothetical protein
MAINKYLDDSSKQIAPRLLVKPTCVLSAAEVVAGIAYIRRAKPGFVSRDQSGNLLSSAEIKKQLTIMYPIAAKESAARKFPFSSHFCRRIYANLSFNMYSDAVSRITGGVPQKGYWANQVLGHDSNNPSVAQSYLTVDVRKMPQAERFAVEPGTVVHMEQIESKQDVQARQIKELQEVAARQQAPAPRGPASQSVASVEGECASAPAGQFVPLCNESGETVFVERLYAMAIDKTTQEAKFAVIDRCYALLMSKRIGKFSKKRGVFEVQNATIHALGVGAPTLRDYRKARGLLKYECKTPRHPAPAAQVEPVVPPAPVVQAAPVEQAAPVVAPGRVKRSRQQQPAWVDADEEKRDTKRRVVPYALKPNERVISEEFTGKRKGGESTAEFRKRKKMNEAKSLADDQAKFKAQHVISWDHAKLCEAEGGTISGVRRNFDRTKRFVCTLPMSV